jgi:hypothetical protein
MVAARGGHSALKSHDVATKLLAEVGGREAAALAYANAFLFMALIGVIAFCLVPIIPPTPWSRDLGAFALKAHGRVLEIKTAGTSPTRQQPPRRWPV